MNTHDPFLDSVLDAVRLENEFNAALLKKIKAGDIEGFTTLFHTHEKDNLSDTDESSLKIKRAKYRLQNFFSFIEHHERDPKQIDDSLRFFNADNLISKSNLLLSLWFYEYDDLVLNLLENDIYSIQEKSYETFNTVLNPNSSNPNRPLSHEEKERYAQQRKEQFIALQKQYGLKINLDRNLPEKNDIKKSLKL